MAQDPDRAQFLFLDFEFGRNMSFHGMAARRVTPRKGYEERVWNGNRFDSAHAELVQWLQPNDIWVGHNVHQFDRPAIAQRKSDSPLLNLPTIDTLALSVLAFPQRPYHRLAKNDKLVRDSKPNPLSDVRASNVVFDDAVKVFGTELAPTEVATLAWLWANVTASPDARLGTAQMFAYLGWPASPPPVNLRDVWSDRACRNSPSLRPSRIDMPLLLLSAWLRVADRYDGSVLPAWVRRSWPQTISLARSLRAVPCDDPDCGWCSTHHSPEYWLQQVFGFPGFRNQPQTNDGQSLQRQLVERGLRGESTFGILPTGGGKSLCFQVPAEARFRLLGQLTVVISPLQSLMKDQVDALANRIPHARALYSGLPSVLRPQIVESVISGECGLLYLSPEQFRNTSTLKMLSQRQIGALVFDEAHCLSQWGHDFRTDYPYVLKALAEEARKQGAEMPPVYLFTATAPVDAIAQIIDHVAEHTKRPPTLLDGGAERTNLQYAVERVPPHNRIQRTAELLMEHMGKDGTGIVFCGSRKSTEATAALLSEHGLPAIAYHAGLDSDQRRELQDDFIRGKHRIIVATNAFGMGVDKPNVRIVVHIDMPSSLEAYLQEAGRGGRDGLLAHAVMLWAPGDSEPRFSMGAISNLEKEDLDALWRAIQSLPNTHIDQHKRIRSVITPRELLFQDALAGRFDPLESNEETRVKAAVNWLEMGRRLERRENQTQVFTGRPRVLSVEEGFQKIDALDLPPHIRGRWQAVLEAVFHAGDSGLSADEIAVLTNTLSPKAKFDGGKQILHILHRMCQARILEEGQTFAAFVHKGTESASSKRFQRASEWERWLVEQLIQNNADWSIAVHLRSIAEQLSTADYACTTQEIGRLLRTWSTASRGHTDAPGKVRFDQHGTETAHLRLDVSPEDLQHWILARQGIANTILQYLLSLAKGNGNKLHVESHLEQLVTQIESNIVHRNKTKSPLDAVQGALYWLHETQIITVTNGLTVFRSAMSIDRDDAPSKASGRNAPTDNTTRNEMYRLLAEHNRHRTLRVHVINRWAEMMVTKPNEAHALRRDWFDLPVAAFQKKWFKKEDEMVSIPTSPESYDAIVNDLDDEQRAIVTADYRRNHLVLAGPGSGKTRILVHRVAWLLRCKRVPAKQIVVICYTRANATELERRLYALVGQDKRHVKIRTLHGIAVSMLGAHRLSQDGGLSLEKCIPEATTMLLGTTSDAEQAIRQRDALLGGVDYLFIDEYQDINEESYDFLSAITGRAMGAEQRKLKVFAVGDDDQSIFQYSGASSQFIGRFESDYKAKRHVVTTNYRNPAAILTMAQDLLRPLPDRLKQDVELRVNPDRANHPPMGPFAASHPDLHGQIVWHRATSIQHAAAHAMNVVHQWLEDGVDPATIAVLTRTRKHGLHRLRVAAEAARVPFTWPLPSEGKVPLSRVEEVVYLLEKIGQVGKDPSDKQLRSIVSSMPQNNWTTALHRWLEPYAERKMPPEVWRHRLWEWVQLERRARTLGAGIHLGTMHSAKGLEFEHVLLFDDQHIREDEIRLLYVALTRARASLQIFSPASPSPVLLRLQSPHLTQRPSPPLPTHGDHQYDMIQRSELFIDWLGQRPSTHASHAAWWRVQVGDAVFAREDGQHIFLVDDMGQPLARLSAEGAGTWRPRLAQRLRIKLLAKVQERANDDFREESYRSRLQMPTWWTGVFECRWVSA